MDSQLPNSDSQEPAVPPADNKKNTNGSSFLRLFLISFACLFLEVLFIRWIASEIRIFGYFKNVILIACVVGMGVGCALGGRQTAEANASKDSKTGRLDAAIFPLLTLILSAIVAFAGPLELTHMTFIFSLDVFMWDLLVPSATAFIRNIIAILAIFIIVVMSFDFLGQKLGAEFHGRDPLKAYGVNLAGSLAGVLVYTALCYFGTSPPVWLTIGFLSIIPFWKRPIHIFMFIASIGLAVMSSQGSTWSPYYRIDLQPFVMNKVEIGRQLDVNHDYHQKTLNFSKEFLAQHPDLKESKDFQIYYNTYNLPCELAPKHDRVLILGAGTGNDVAAALRAGAQHVDAVEIDPTIQNLGKSIHPENPYADSRVNAINNDARAFLGNTKEKYDVIVFGHVDSHTTFSTLGSVRLDNYLYTKESLQAATNALSDRGLAALSFAAGPEWLRARLYQVVRAVAPSEPVVLRTHFDNPGSITILWGPGLEEINDNLKATRGKDFIPVEELNTPIELPTDDWPFLYQQFRNIPPFYLALLVTVFTIGSGIILSRMRLNASALTGYWQFMLLGAGFLLLETRGMLAVSVLIGSTWLVNSLVIAVILITALCANFLVMKVPSLKEWHGYAGLLGALLLLYFMPLSQFSGESIGIKLLVSFVALGLPVIFSGIVFSRAFSKAKEPECALGVNILGALVGGCLEYTSTIVGTNGLTLIAIAIYALSFFTRTRDSK